MTCSRQHFISVINSSGAPHNILRIQHLPDVCRELAVWFFVRDDDETLGKTKELIREYLLELDATGGVTFQ